MTPAIVAGLVTVLILGILLPLAICTDSKRREQAQVRARVVPVGTTAPVAEALAQAVEHHINNGGNVEDVIGFESQAHPCGSVHIHGQRAMWALSPDGQKAWDSLGLLEYARQLEQGGIVADALGGA